MSAEHHYAAQLVWEGKPDLVGTADPAFLGVMKTTPDGGGRFESVTLHPKVEIADKSRETLAMELHEKAHLLCFIARSVNFSVLHTAAVTVRE
jgi:organic hydroperoxide reductase OsmC/OhrA